MRTKQAEAPAASDTPRQTQEFSGLALLTSLLLSQTGEDKKKYRRVLRSMVVRVLPVINALHRLVARDDRSFADVTAEYATQPVYDAIAALIEARDACRGNHFTAEECKVAKSSRRPLSQEERDVSAWARAVLNDVANRGQRVNEIADGKDEN